MDDISKLSDAQLQALYGAAPSSLPDVSKMTDAELLQAYGGDQSYAGDIAKSAAAGLAGGTAGVIGGLGDLREAASAGVDWVGKKLGASPDNVQRFKNIASSASKMTGAGYVLANAPTTEQVLATADPIVDPKYKPETLGGDYAKSIGQFAPGAFVGGRGVVSNVLRGAVLPGVASESAGQLTKGSDAEPYARAGAAILAPAAASIGRRAIVPNAPSAERQALAETLRNENVPLTAGQSTGSKPLQWMESVLGDTMGSGGAAARAVENQGEAFTAAALRRAGIDANRATPDVLDNAFNRIGNVFEQVGQRNNVVRDGRLTHDINTTIGEYNNLVSQSNRAPVVMNTARDVMDAITRNGGHLTGEQYNAFTSRLAKQARNAQTDPQLREALQGIRSALDDAMERTLFRTGNSADMQALRGARNEYRNLMVLEKAATGAGSNAAEGLISPSQLRNAVVQQGRRDYGRGRGDFADLARAGEALLKPLPNSGTSPRHNISQLLHTVGAVVGGGAGSAGGPMGTALGAMAGIAVPAALGRTLLSGPVQRRLANPRGTAEADTRALTNLLLSSGSFRAPVQ